MNLLSNIQLKETSRVKRPSGGYIYRSIIDLNTLYESLKKGVLKYSPRYQRGTANHVIDPTDEVLDSLYHITDMNIAIQSTRVHAIAAKFLMGLNNAGKQLFNWEVVWNARRENGEDCVTYDEPSRTLEINTEITIPDSGHRHAAYHALGMWKRQPKTIPAEVMVDPGDSCTAEDIRKWLKIFEPTENHVYVVCFNVSKDEEGLLYAELNGESTKPSPSKAVSLNYGKDPSGRLVRDLLLKSEILATDQIETQKSTIGKKSSKLVTVNTLKQAFKPFVVWLKEIEERPEERLEFLNYLCAWYEEWAAHFPVYLPTANAKQRHDFRSQSYALSNIMTFAILRIAVNIYRTYVDEARDYQTDDGWRDSISTLASDIRVKIPIEDPDTPGGVRMEDWTGPVFSVENPKWQGGITIKKTNKKGEIKWSISSTRDTREFAFDYLSKLLGLS